MYGNNRRSVRPEQLAYDGGGGGYYATPGWLGGGGYMETHAYGAKYNVNCNVGGPGICIIQYYI